MNRFFLSALTIWIFSFGAPAADIQKLRGETEQLRGLKFKSEIAVERVTSAEMKKVITRELDRDFPGDDFAAHEKALKAFGLIPARTDLRKAMEELLSGQVAGIYDPRDKKLYLLAAEKDEGDDPLFDLASVFDAQELFIVHELSHALADQHFDLLKSLKLGKKGNDDEVAAALSVAEGDATLTMFRFLSRKTGVEGTDFSSMAELFDGGALIGEFVGNDVPKYLGETLLFSYLKGMKFVSEVSGGKPEAVNKLYSFPPLSTEQVLHPKKYVLGNDPPLKVVLEVPRELRGRGAKVVAEGTWGELVTRIVLEEWGADEALAIKAAEGWGGDRYAVVEDGKGDLWFKWKTVWDSGMEAAEFESAVRGRNGISVSRKGVEVMVEKTTGRYPGGNGRKGESDAKDSSENRLQ